MRERKSHESFCFFSRYRAFSFGGHDHDYITLGEEDDYIHGCKVTTGLEGYVWGVWSFFFGMDNHIPFRISIVTIR